MSALPTYSTLFSTLYDEQKPIGDLGRGTHYSVCRCVEWLDVVRKPLALPQVHDFAIIWDEDHDTRVIKAIEALYMKGLFSPVQFIGESRGKLTILTASRFHFQDHEASEKWFFAAEQAVDSALDNDTWPVEFGMFDRSTIPGHQFHPASIINDSERRVELYLKNIDSLWSLGTYDWASS